MNKSVNPQYFQKLNGDYSAAYKETAGSENPSFHIHEEYEALLCLSDDMFCYIDKTRYSIKKNTLLLFNNMDMHHFGPVHSRGINRRYVVYFKPAYLESLSTEQVNLLDCFLFRPFDDSQILPLSEEEARQLTQHLERILEMQKRPEEEIYGKELYLQLLLAELLLHINTFYRRYHHITSDSGDRQHRRIYSIMNYIHENYTEELSLDLLAKKFYINKFYLCEAFKKIAGITPNQYLINCRIMKAKELLIQGNSAENACSLSGFNNMSHFSRTFKNKVGLSPKQYQIHMRIQKTALQRGFNT